VTLVLLKEVRSQFSAVQRTDRTADKNDVYRYTVRTDSVRRPSARQPSVYIQLSVWD